MKDYSDAYFDRRQGPSRSAAEVIVPRVIELVRPRSVVDVGCALGEWLAVFRERGVDDVLGVDGNHVNREKLLVPEESFRSLDLASKIELERSFDLAVSLEVAEHLPEDVAETFVESLVSLAPVVLFSAAIPYQGGTGHINEQWQGYWAALFEKHGYLAVDALRRDIWDNEKVPRWYRQNILLYVRAEVIEGNSRLKSHRDSTARGQLNIVHPLTYLKRARPSTRKVFRLLRQRLREGLRSRLSRLFGR